MKSIEVASVMLLLCVVGSLGAPLQDLAKFGYDPRADSSAVIVSGKARFTVLTDYVIRMEYDESSHFEDRATIAVVNRKLPVPSFTQNISNGVLTITTSKVTLWYVVGASFTSASLSGTGAGGAKWQYGDTDYGNLFGTIRSLDVLCTVSLNCTQNAGTMIHNESLHCAWGVISRGGWTTIDDTNNFIMSNTAGEWFSSSLRSTEEVDLYFFGHDTDYRRALKDFTSLSGNIPMLPRPMLGSWFTRWFDFDNSDIERLIDIYQSESLPLTTLVFDMNWHTKNAWTGFSWDKTLFPHPQDTLAWLRSKGLIVAANLHDAEGVGFWEDTYNKVCQAVGQNPAGLQAVPFQPLNATYMHALEDITLVNANLDFYWIDWQQGGWAGGCTGGRLNPTLITDHVRSTDNLRRGLPQRDAVLARFGGLGNHRYPVGFSGDVQDLTWECMSFQPYFSITGANVGYGYISNDLVGPANDHELHVRWMQFGAYSGVMRIHDRGMSAGSCYKSGTCAIVNMWKLPFKYFSPIRDAMLARVALLPYLYTESYNAFLSGVTPTYPLYYDWPTHADAYIMGPDGVHAQYMFGSQMMVAPICQAADTTNNLASKEVWLPPGVWYDDIFGSIHKSTGMKVRQQYALEDVPLFVKAGAIIPRIPNPEKIGVGTDRYDALDIYIYPGADSNTYALYEDDGMTYAYLDGTFVNTLISFTRTSSSITITTTGLNTTHSWLPASRRWRFFLVGTLPLTTATANGKTLPYQRFPGSSGGSWHFDGKTGTTIVETGECSTVDALTINASFIASDNATALSRVKGYASRSRLAKRLLDDVRETPYSENTGPGLFKTAAAHAVDLTYLAGADPTHFLASIGSSYTQLMEEALTEIGGNPNPVQHHKDLTQLYDVDRNDMLLCGSKDCLSTNYQYTVMWTEGYQPSSSTSAAESLKDYYSSQLTDNYATTATTAPNGYLPAVFSNGMAYTQGGTNRVCLDVYFSSSTNDHLTTATKQGRDFAHNNGYTKVHDCVGYVQTTPPQSLVHARKHSSNMTAGELLDVINAAEKQLGGVFFSQAQALMASALPEQ